MIANSYHTKLESCDLSFGDKGLTGGMLRKIRTACPDLTRLGYRHDMFQLPRKHDSISGRTHGVTRKHIKGFDDYFPKYAKDLVHFANLESVVFNFEPYESDDSSTTDSDSNNDSREEMHQRLALRILPHIEVAASNHSPERSKISTVVLHDKALAGEDVLGEEYVVSPSHYEREYKGNGRGVQMRFLQ